MPQSKRLRSLNRRGFLVIFTLLPLLTSALAKVVYDHIFVETPGRELQ